MWNDIDMYHAYRDFTLDPVAYPVDEFKAFVDELVCALRPRSSVSAHAGASARKQPALYPDCRCRDSQADS